MSETTNTHDNDQANKQIKENSIINNSNNSNSSCQLMVKNISETQEDNNNNLGEEGNNS